MDDFHKKKIPLLGKRHTWNHRKIQYKLYKIANTSPFRGKLLKDSQRPGFNYNLLSTWVNHSEVRPAVSLYLPNGSIMSSQALLDDAERSVPAFKRWTFSSEKPLRESHKLQKAPAMMCSSSMSPCYQPGDWTNKQTAHSWHWRVPKF